MDWLKGKGIPFQPSQFMTREIYGRYLKDQFVKAVFCYSGELCQVASECHKMTHDHSDYSIITASDDVFIAEEVVLALGNFPPALTYSFLGDLDKDFYLN